MFIEDMKEQDNGNVSVDENKELTRRLLWKLDIRYVKLVFIYVLVPFTDSRAEYCP